MTAALFTADWVLPVSSPPIRDGAVRVNGDGLIDWVGSRGDAADDGAPVVELGNSALLPGLVNVHSHPELTLLRGRLESDSFAGWIESLIDFKYNRLDAEASRVSTWLGVAESIAAGVTCIAAPDDAGFLMAALDESGVRGRVYREVFGPDPAVADAALSGLEAKVTELRERASDRVEVGISPHAPYTVSKDLFVRLTEYALAESLPMTVHVAESEAEERFVRYGVGPLADRLLRRGIEVQATGATPVEQLAGLGVLEARPLLVHCVNVEEADVQRIAESGSTIAHCPIANAKFGHGVAPLLYFLEVGIPVGLGSDSVASNNRIDLLEEARAATLLQRSTYRVPGVLSPSESLRLATLEGARALGLDDRIGSLEPGKSADMTAVALGRPWTTPTGDPAAALIHSARGSDVIMTAVQGKVLFRDGEYRTLDWAELARAARDAESSLTAEGGTGS